MQPFVMERWQSLWENRVRYNLSESGVEPLTLGELLELAGAEDEALGTGLGYGQSNGTEVLRERIAQLYGGADIADIVVTNGSAEANLIAAWQLVEPGDTVAVLMPTYMQLPGLADAFGGRVREIPLREELGWQPDPDEAAAAIDDGTRLVVVTNPQNPTGMLLADEALDAVLSAAERVGAWVLADEVYAGAEADGRETPSLFGRYDRVIATGSLSKAYGLPGLRVGWAAVRGGVRDTARAGGAAGAGGAGAIRGSADAVAGGLAGALWARKDYTTISPGLLTDTLAALALRPDVRPRILERTRGIIRENREVVRRWAEDSGFVFTGHQAGAVCFLRYDLPLDSAELAERLRVEHDVLVVPGAHFGMGPYVRIGFGIEREPLEAGLERVSELVRTL